MALAERDKSDPLRVLEIGHYYGLSTCGLVHAMRRRGGTWSLVTVDSHEADGHVLNPAGIGQFIENRDMHFRDRRLHTVHGRSQMFVAPIRYDFVFYDGDHAGEQARFTEEVIKSQEVKTFVFDDADFPVPMECSKMLVSAGWVDRSPVRRRVQGDKSNAQTMTLGVFQRGD